MPVLIDGNNLQFAAIDHEPDLPVGRAKLCRILGQWARKTGERVQVIFDGPSPAGALAEQIGDPGISVRFSGSGVSADAVLKELIGQDSAPRRLTVVSSDREVARAARRREASAVKSDGFWKQVLRDLSRGEPDDLEPREKQAGLSPDETQRWLRELGLDEGFSGPGVGPKDRG